MYVLFDVTGKSKCIGAYSTVEAAVKAANDNGIEHFIVFPDNGGSYVYCSW